MKNEILSLKEQLHMERSIMSSEQLHSDMQETRRQNDKLQKEIEKMTIELACINKRHLNEIKSFSRRQGEEISYHKRRYTELFSRFQVVKKELDASQHLFICGKQSINEKAERKGNFLEVDRRTMEKRGSISFEFSEQSSE